MGYWPGVGMGKNWVVVSPLVAEFLEQAWIDYLDFVPQGPKAILLKELLQLYLNDGLEFDVKFIIESASIVTVPWNDRRLRLGSTIWLGRPKEELVAVDYSYEQYVDKS